VSRIGESGRYFPEREPLALAAATGELVSTTHLRAIADANPLLKGIIDRVDFNATTHGVRDLADDRLSNVIEAISARLGLADVEPDIIGRRAARTFGAIRRMAST